MTKLSSVSACHGLCDFAIQDVECVLSSGEITLGISWYSGTYCQSVVAWGVVLGSLWTSPCTRLTAGLGWPPGQAACQGGAGLGAPDVTEPEYHSQDYTARITPS